MAKESGTGVSAENVIIQAGGCSVTLLPRLGGKIASILLNGQELLQAPLAAYAPRTRTMPFDAGDASGWDECLPSVAPCTVETTAGTAAIPDHGDLWRVKWKKSRKQGTAEAKGKSVTLCGECFSLPLRLERTTTLTETAEGQAWRLQADYKVTNTGSYPSPWSWAVHPMYAAEAGDRIVLPHSISSLILEGSGGGRLGQAGIQVSWPSAKLARGGETDLSMAQWADSGVGDKLFAGPLASSENWCALERYKAGVRIRVGFNPSATPYLGLWLCYGGWPERPGTKQVCVGMEPTTAPFDSLARTGYWSRVLAPGESSSWPMVVDFEKI
jgi:galactose mutarotase-like enzyme